MNTQTFSFIGGYSVYRQLCQVREDGRTWLGAHWTDYDWQGKKIGERTTWNGCFTSSRGIDDPAIRERLPLWQRAAYWLGLYGKESADDGSQDATEVGRLCGACGRQIPVGGGFDCGTDHSPTIRCPDSDTNAEREA